MKVSKPTLTTSGSGAIIYLPDGTQTEVFLKTKRNVLDEINRLCAIGRINKTEKHNLIHDLFFTDSLEAQDILDDIILFYLVCRDRPLQSPTFEFGIDPAIIDVPPHGRIVIDISDMIKTEYTETIHKPHFDPIPGIRIYTKDYGYIVIKSLLKYHLLSKKDFYTLRESIKNTTQLIDAN